MHRVNVCPYMHVKANMIAQLVRLDCLLPRPSLGHVNLLEVDFGGCLRALECVFPV